MADRCGQFLKTFCARKIALVKNHSGKAARKIFREFAGKGIAVESQHEACEYGISRFRFGLGLYVHLV
jgi:hypothetical protein